ncbi:MAG: DUF2079 domain-containing protein [Polyangiaceae bacterium]|nr:DUF2079 domain-containing protein [Polyangiaceae bacterium]
MSIRDNGHPTSPGEALPLATLLARAGLFLSFIGAGVAMGVWFLLRRDLVTYAKDNALIEGSAWDLLISSGATAAACSAAAGVYCLIVRTRQSVKQVHRVASMLLPLSLVFALPLFFRLELWKNRELFFSSTVLIWGFVLERSLRIAVEAWPRSSILADLRLLYPRLVRWAPFTLVTLMVLGYFAYMSYGTLLRHYQMVTRSYDIGIYNNTFWNLLHGELFYSSPCLGMRGSQLQYHATLTAYLLLPFYALYPHTEALIVIQAALCSLAGFPLYGIVRRRLDSPWLGVAFVAAYCLYGPAHGAMFYDFHFLTISTPFVITALYCFETRKRLWFWIALALALLDREDLGIGLSAVFLSYLIAGERPRVALVAGIVSIGYAAFGKFVFMPLFSHSLADSFLYAYKEYTTTDAPGFSGVVRTWLTNPYFFASRVLNEEKFTYFLIVMVPVLLLPLRHPRTWLFLAMGGLITVFSYAYPPLLEISFQYTAAWTAFIFVASAIAISTWREEVAGWARIRAAVVAMVVVGVLMSYRFGAFVRDNGFVGGFLEMTWDYTDTDRQELADLRALIARIPPDASVTVSEYELPHVSSRRDCFTLSRGHSSSDYVLVRISEGRAAGSASHATMAEVVNSGEYGILETRGAFQLWKRGADRRHNREAARALGLTLPR